jgi:hypothetical protein
MANGTEHKGPGKRHIALGMSLFLAVSSLASVPAFAMWGVSTPYRKQSQKEKEALKKPSDKPNFELVEQIAHQPELMNLRYLQYVIGPPEKTPNQIGYVKRYYWRDPDPNADSIKFELVQTESAPGRICQSVLIARMENLDDVDLKKLESRYGSEPSKNASQISKDDPNQPPQKGYLSTKKFFDQQSCPNLQYVFVPNTYVDFKQPQDTFHITQATITYKGECLPPLSAVSLLQAQQAYRTLALDHHKNERWRQAVPALRNHVAEHPEDAEARIALAEAYRGNCNVNEAIEQYRIAMGETNDPQVAQQCLKGLQEMRVLPKPDADPPQQHQLKIVHNGQRFRIADEEKQQKPQPQPGFNVQPMDPPSILPTYDPVAGF